MNIAIDFDGTISRSPRLLLQLAQALRNSGHRVIILTAAAGELPPTLRPAEVGKRLSHLGWSEFIPHIRCCESCEKPDICWDQRIDILIDDSPFKLQSTFQLMPAP